METEKSFIVYGKLSSIHINEAIIGDEVFTELLVGLKQKIPTQKMDAINLKQGSQMNIEDLPLKIIAKIKRAFK